MTTRQRNAHLGGVGVALIVALTGCGTATSKPSPSDPGTSAATTSFPVSVESARSAALVAYQGMIGDWVRASKTSDNRDPRLAEHTSGPALTDLQLRLGAVRLAGLHTEGAPKDDPQVRDLRSETAPIQILIVDCMDATAWLDYKADGSVADTGPNGRHRVEAVVEGDHDAWKVTRLIVRDVGSC